LAALLGQLDSTDVTAAAGRRIYYFGFSAFRLRRVLPYTA
jgi:hypothetical protein